MSDSEGENRPAGDASAPRTDDERAGGPGDRTSKAEVAARERGERAYSETYGRGAGERFAGDDYPHAYGSPGRLDWRRALRAYVAGHDRGWEADRKYAAAAGRDEGGGRPAHGGAPERHDAPDAAARPSDEATGRTGRGTRFGVGVAEPGEMTFHRSASTWRERLPRTPRMPRHGSPDPADRAGRGEQA